MRICVPKEIYPKIVVLKAAYQFTDRAYIYIQQTSEDYLIDMKPKDESNQIVEDEFKNELLSQTLRHEVYLQTKEIRQFITMRALASTIVGKQAETIQPTQNFDENDILKDWFDDRKEV